MAEYDVVNLVLTTLGDRVAARWDAVGAPETAICYVYLDGIFVGTTYSRLYMFYGDGVHHVAVYCLDDGDAFDVESRRPGVPTTRPVITWTRPVSAGVAITDIVAFNVYQGDTAGGAVDTTEIVKRVFVQPSDWAFTVVMDALVHGQSRRFRVSPVNAAGNEDVSLATDVLFECIGISPHMVVAASSYSSPSKTLTLVLVEAP